MYKLHYDVFLATMKEAGTFVTKHTVINYVNQLAAAQQLACLNGAGGSDGGAGVGGGGGGAGVVGSGGATATGAGRRFLPSQVGSGRQIERSSASDARSGFRSARPTRGRSMPWTLTIEVPSSDSGTGTGTDTVKGSKASGSVKVHNQFSGLDVDM